MRTYISKLETRNSKLNCGNAWVGILLLLTFIITVGLILTGEVISGIAQSKKSSRISVAQSLCDGGIEKALWKLNQTGGTYSGETNLFLETGTIDITINTISTEVKEVIVSAYVPNKNASPAPQRTVRAKLVAEPSETNVAFKYGVHLGGLGMTMSNNAVLNGNVYTAGGIECATNATIKGDAFISKNETGQYGTISNCKIGGNAEGYNITGSDVTGWIRYVGLKTGTSTGGGATQITQETLDTEVPLVNLPLSPTSIDTWKGWASDGGTYSGNYNLATGQSAALGPKKIDGNLVIDTGATLTLTGTLWVKGNVILNSGSTLNLSPTYGSKSGMIIADNPDDLLNSGYIRVNSNVAINGSGTPNTYILLLSTSQKTTTTDPAIFAGNNSNAVVYYTTEGMIEVNNNATLRAVSGGGLHLSNGAIVNYDSGLASTNFSGGPGAAWVVKEWQIVHD